MRTVPSRRHIPHFERENGTCHVTWRLHRSQPPLTADERTIVLETMRRAETFGCRFCAAVVMVDHVHALFTPGGRRTSGAFIQAWKSVSAHRICDLRIRTAPLWQRDFFQRWLRSDAVIARCTEYIRNNPRQRWPGVTHYPWFLP